MGGPCAARSATAAASGGRSLGAEPGAGAGRAAVGHGARGGRGARASQPVRPHRAALGHGRRCWHAPLLRHARRLLAAREAGLAARATPRDVRARGAPPAGAAVHREPGLARHAGSGAAAAADGGAPGGQSRGRGVVQAVRRWAHGGTGRQGPPRSDGSEYQDCLVLRQRTRRALQLASPLRAHGQERATTGHDLGSGCPCQCGPRAGRGSPRPGRASRGARAARGAVRPGATAAVQDRVGLARL
mmetsp:Transcript_17049/g.54727  ORF Transcript_17049/g.54727 Transcript_17049/m.54727 type:complete len:245 (+) Transcript_17049:721-1455(+)